MTIDLRDKAYIEQLIQKEHWEQGRSLRAIERHYGITITSLSWWCKRHGIPVRAKTESISVYAATAEGKANRPRGERHWCYGLRKETSALFQRHSARMTQTNPATDYDTMARMSAGRAIYLREHPNAREQLVLAVLNPRSVPGLIFQYPLGIYILDFAFPYQRIVLEIDGATHRRQDRIAHDTIRTQALLEADWIQIRHTIQLRASHPKGCCLHPVGHILETLMPDLHLTYPQPPNPRSKYGVILCSQEYPTGIRVYTPQDPRLIALAHRLRDRSPLPVVG